jgi:cellulose 1,4-beta-cellobiosidase
MRPSFPIRTWRAPLWWGVAVTAATALGCGGMTVMATAPAGATTTVSPLKSAHSGAADVTAHATGYRDTAIPATRHPSGTGGGLVVDPASFAIAPGTSEVFGVSLPAVPRGDVRVTVSRTWGNAGLTVSAGATLTFTPGNWKYPQPVTVTAGGSGGGRTTFTARAAGYAPGSATANEHRMGAPLSRAHVVNPFAGATWYVNPDYKAEVATSVAGASGTLAAKMRLVGNQPTGIWLDHIGAIYGGSDNHGSRSLEAQMYGALRHAAGRPVLIPIVIYDLPNRDCAALASNGELTIGNHGLEYYEQDYINPIAQVLTSFSRTNIRVIAVIEPDSLPNLVTNLSDPKCAQANSSGAYVDGVRYALNKLHGIPSVYNYVDIAHSAWLGWPSNMNAAVSLYKSVTSGTTAGLQSVDGFISNTANYTPTTEPYMTATKNVGYQPVDSAKFYQYDPYIDELSYDKAMYSKLVAAGFPGTIGMLIDTSRNGWGGPNRPTRPSTSTVVNTFVDQSKIDERPFRGDWCNQNGAGLGAFPSANPVPAFGHLYAYVWIKPPGESDGDYPTATHAHGDPHCNPSGTLSDGNGNTYPANSIPGYDVPAGRWFPAEFQMLVQNAHPRVP